MLETSLFESGGRAQKRKPATVFASVALHGVVIVFLLLIPIVQPQAIPMLTAAVGIPLPVTTEKSAAKPVEPAPEPRVQPYIQLSSTVLTQPVAIPSDIALVIDDPADRIAGVAGARPGDIRGVIASIVEDRETVAPPPPPPPLPPA